MALYQAQGQTQQARAQHNLAQQARLIALSVMAQRNGEEFEAALAAEARENPAIEIEERTQCPRCGKSLRMGFCAACDALGAFAAGSGSWSTRQLTGEPHALSTAAAAESLAARVLRQLRASLPDADANIAAYLTGSLDEHGFLTATALEVAAALNVAVARVERAISALQTLDPPGVGSRNVTECLLRQLEACGERPTPAIARALIADYLPDLAERRFERIAHALHVSVAEAQAGWAFIRENLTPYPANLFDASADVVQPGAVPIWPDVIFRPTPGGDFAAEIVERRRYRLTVQPLYAELAEAPASRNGHVQTYVARAQEFIGLAQRRWETLAQISEALAEAQRDFLARGSIALHPMTRLELAQFLGLSESTVCRAIDGKYALLPTGRIVSFAVFFDASLPIKERLLALVEAEDRGRPLHDYELADRLVEQGVSIAPRTVTKYREALGIAAPRLRARLK